MSASESTPQRPHVVVVGAGIAGLTAAHALHEAAGDSLRVTVLEKAAVVGGKLAAGEIAGQVVDLGAESFLARRSEVHRLAAAVGLEEDLVEPATSGAAVWSRGKLRSLPPGHVMGIPGDLRGLAATEILSLCGLARIPLDSVLPASASTGDRSLGHYVEERLGREVVDRLVEPLLGGVYAGRADELSLDAVLPQLSGAVRVERSLLRAVRRISVATSSSPVFGGVAGGLARLPVAVGSGSGATIRTGQTVRGLRRSEHGWMLTLGPTSKPERVFADAVILAVPATPAARLLRRTSPAASELIEQTPYASVGIVTLALARRDVPDLPSGTGFLVPPVEGRLVKAVTFSSQKWAWVGRSTPQLHVLRASVGRVGEEAVLQRDDAELVSGVLGDVGELLGWPLALRPVDSLVTRWGGALPQYLVGHLDRVAAVRAATQLEGTLAVCGAAYDGVGVPACIASGQAAAGRVLRALGSRRQWGHGVDTRPAAGAESRGTRPPR